MPVGKIPCGCGLIKKSYFSRFLFIEEIMNWDGQNKLLLLYRYILTEGVSLESRCYAISRHKQMKQFHELPKIFHE